MSARRSPLRLVAERLRALAKRVRDTPAVNGPLTAIVRDLLYAKGLHLPIFVKHLPRRGPVESRLPNGRVFRMWSGGDDWVPNQVFWLGWSGYEPETARVFFEIAARSEVAIDVGAHVGFYSLLAAHANPAGRVVALEPIAATFERLRGNVAMNGLSNVDCMRVAADDKPGRAQIYVPREGPIPCSAGLSERFYGPWRDAFHGVEVNTDTLDSIMAGRPGRVGLVKIDTEGTEPRVLRGALRLLQEHRPSIVCEVLAAAESAGALEEQLRPLGYRFHLLTDTGPVVREHIEPDDAHPNYLFTPPAEV